MKARLVFICSLILFTSQVLSAQQFKVFLFTKTAGWHHESIHEGVAAIRKLAERNNFQVDWQENTDFVTEKNLEKYQAIIFLNTTADILNDEQQKAVEKFIQSGKGFVGIHSASDTEYGWPWYTKMVGMMFKIHPEQQTAYLRVLDHNFPGMERFAAKSTDLKFLVTVDEKTYNPNAKWGDNVGKGMGDFHPISWYHPYDGGRAFYTALGHIPATFSDQTFLDHIYGGIYWAATGKGIE
jgi:uncharacterized protein